MVSQSNGLFYQEWRLVKRAVFDKNGRGCLVQSKYLLTSETECENILASGIPGERSPLGGRRRGTMPTSEKEKLQERIDKARFILKEAEQGLTDAEAALENGDTTGAKDIISRTIGVLG
jgi:hypothetical protein